MNIDAFNPEQTALLVVDLQNDFLHPEGAYGRAGQSSESIAKLPKTILPVANALRKMGGWIISTQFTLVPGKQEVPFISAHLKTLRPFLGVGDFKPGGWGHTLVDELQPADLVVEKIAYSAFYMTRMEWVLKKAGIQNLLICGIVTNGGVASTVRDAHVRDFNIVVLSDGCSAFSSTSHEQAIKDMSTITTVMTCMDAVNGLTK